MTEPKKEIPTDADPSIFDRDFPEIMSFVREGKYIYAGIRALVSIQKLKLNPYPNYAIEIALSFGQCETDREVICMYAYFFSSDPRIKKIHDSPETAYELFP